MILFGTRWYDAEREVMLSPDPLLVTAPRVLIDQPALGAAYTFAGASPTANVDPTGLAFFSAHQRLEVRRQDQATFDSKVKDLLATGDADDTAKAQKMMSDRDEKAESQNRAELLDANALIQIDPYEGTVSVGAPYGPRKTWGEDKPTAGPSSTDAADDKGGPDDGSTGVSQGSVSPSVADDAGSGSEDDAGSGSGSDSGSTGSVSDSGQRQPPVDPAGSSSQD